MEKNYVVESILEEIMGSLDEEEVSEELTSSGYVRSMRKEITDKFGIDDISDLIAVDLEGRTYIMRGMDALSHHYSSKPNLSKSQIYEVLFSEKGEIDLEEVSREGIKMRVSSGLYRIIQEEMDAYEDEQYFEVVQRSLYGGSIGESMAREFDWGRLIEYKGGFYVLEMPDEESLGFDEDDFIEVEDLINSENPPRVYRAIFSIGQYGNWSDTRSAEKELAPFMERVKTGRERRRILNEEQDYLHAFVTALTGSEGNLEFEYIDDQETINGVYAAALPQLNLFEIEGGR